MNRLRALGEAGQSFWLDYLRRSFVEKGELARAIAEDGLRGITSNPSIFEQAIAGSDEYAAAIRDFTAQGSPTVAATYEHLAMADIRAAADELRPVYDMSARADGYVSLECSPYLADDTRATIAEGVHLWQSVDRPNLMVKVPATDAGLPAIRALIGKGINVNVTLLFTVATYRKVVEAYCAGLEDLHAAGGDIAKVASVASFFVSRIDGAVDQVIEDLAGEALADPAAGQRLRGRIAVANAKLAWVESRTLFAGPRWQALAQAGARPQRLLWASTSTKSRDLPDTFYVDALVGRDTVNTIPPKTADAFRDHGTVEPEAIASAIDEARRDLADLAALGIDIEALGRDLVRSGVRQFNDAFDRLLAATTRQTREAAPLSYGATAIAAGSEQAAAKIEATLDHWRREGLVRRLWAMDPTLWTGKDEDRWGGWLTVVDDQLAGPSPLTWLVDHVRDKGLTDVVLLGMGGSSLGPQVLAEVLGKERLRFHMLDSTDPRQIARLAAAIRFESALIITSSKSGTTLEPDIFTDYFRERMAEAVGRVAVGQHFVAVTDPGSALERRARYEGWAAIFPGLPSIGGRYSVLSNFGMVPAAAIGIDVGDLLRRTQPMVRACGADVPPAENPGVRLGVALGVAARDFGRDKVTLVVSPALAPLGGWLEQLLAESTGKEGRGLIPVADEPLGSAQVYGADRIFVHVELAGDDPAQRAALAALGEAGHPVVTLTVNEPADIGQEFFRWEIAVAVAGAIIGIDPFDQPDVEASKVRTRKLTDAEERGEAPVAPVPLFAHEGLTLYADPANAAALGRQDSLAAYLAQHCARIGPGDYAALLAFIDRSAEATRVLTAIRTRLRDARKVATCLGFGPRFLHSTGQAYKGGPNSGVMIQITCDDAEDLAIPGRRVSFGMVKAAQAQGDLEVLIDRARRVLRIHLHEPVTGLPRLAGAFDEALALLAQRAGERGGTTAATLA